MRNAHKILVGEPEGKRPLGRRRRRWKDNIRFDFREIGLEGVLDASGSGQGPMSGCCKHGNEPSSYIKGGDFDWLSGLMASQGLCVLHGVSYHHK
jgi:hypothetical protein